MIVGVHTLLFSKGAVRDRALLRDVLGFPYVDAGEGWLIFRVPPAEMGVHPSEGEPHTEVSFMTDDLEGDIQRLQGQGCTFTPVADRGYGLVTRMTMPGGAELELYEPRHELAITLPSLTADSA